MIDLIRSVASYTLTGPVRCHAMIEALIKIDCDGIDGDVVECGVWRGGNIILARKVSPKRVCWLYDTFSGMTEPGPEDMRKSGAKATDDYAKRQRMGMPWCVAGTREVKSALTDSGVMDHAFLRFVVGDVTETLLDATNLPERIALLRLDTDWYASTKAELETLYPRLSPGGILIVDDYGHWQGARKAVDEYFGDDAPVMTKIDYSAVLMVKPC